MTPLPDSATINGVAVGPVTQGDVSPGYWTYGAQTALGDGAYARQVKLPPGMPGNRRIAVINAARVTDWYQER